MEKYLYRFRGLKRLLGDGDGHGELEKLEIFFSAPSQLNDPLEGYKDIFWSGDIIVWRNLLKHYISCLVQHVLSGAIADNDVRHESAIKINTHCNLLPNDMVLIIERAQASTLSHKEVQLYIEALSDFRKIRVANLIFHFQNLHRICLYNVLIELEAKRLFPYPAKYVIQQVHIDLAGCAQTASALMSDLVHDFHDSMYEVAYGFMLASKLDRANDNLSSAWVFLMMEFPEEFCKSLELMTQPEWYTACFMDECTNSSVWGTYGENHTGICLIYEPDFSPGGQPFLQIEIPFGMDSRGIIKGCSKVPLHQIDYEKGFVEIDFFRSLGTIPASVANRYWYYDSEGNASECSKHMYSEAWRDEYWDNLKHAFTTKLSDWKYEREYRAILQPSILNLSDATLRSCKYRFESLNGIIFGIKTPSDYKRKAIEVIRGLCKAHGRSQFNVYQARYNPTMKKITKFKILVDI